MTIADLPADTYDFYVYATRASDNGAPVIEFQRAGVSLWTKGTTLWGNGWYSTYWDEHEQYVRFRNIAVNNQPIVLDFYPDSYGYASVSGLQIVPSAAIPSEQPVITKLLNVDFGGNGSPYKVGLAAVGITANDFWNGDFHPGQSAVSLANLKWSDQTVSPVAMTVLNGPGCWGNSLLDPMFLSYMYAGDGGNIPITLTDLPSGICDVYLYGHTPNPDDNAVFELWSDNVNWGTKGTSLIGPGPTYANWEVGQQYVLFKDVTVTAGKPVIIHAKHTTYGYNNVSGMQIAYTGAADTDADGLPDGWERRCFNNLDQIATADADGDGLTNLREYQLGTDPTRADSNANGISDLYDFETVWVEDSTPQGGYENGWNEWWNWVSYWYDGDGWGGQVVYPHSGRSWDPRMHVSENVPGDLHQHYFSASVATMRPGAGDVLYAYVNLDSSYPPSEVMLQWYVVDENGYGSWEHRAYWGADLIGGGENGTESRYPMGALPAAGQWVRLEVPASAVGLEGKIVEGMAFTLYSGRAAWDSAGTMKPDHDGDGLPDSWEMQYFGNLLQTATGDPDEDWLNNLEEYQHGTNPTNPDTDGDGLWDSEELEIYIDASNHSLGYLDPLNPDTGSTGKTDDLKDGDHDALSNLAELRDYMSYPWTAHTFKETKDDGQYLLTAKRGETDTMAKLTVNPHDGVIDCVISDAFPTDAYDLYYAPDFAHMAYSRKWRRIHCGSPGQTQFTVRDPNPGEGYFIILAAEDRDADGLSDGWEIWRLYAGKRTVVGDQDSDVDGMLDGWEGAYGLNPTDNTGVNGPAGNPDADAYPNYASPDNGEYNKNPLFAAPSYDPFKPYGSTAPGQQARPVVSISTTDSEADLLGGTANFTIQRSIGLGADLSQALTVYYSVGGSASYASDYSLMDDLNQPPGGYPRIFSATVQAGQTAVRVTLTTILGGLNPAGFETVIIKLTPAGVATEPQTVDDPAQWGYALDLFHETVTLKIHNGILINLEKTTPDGYLRIKPISETSPLPFINVANSVRGTVARIYTGANPASDPSRIVGEYFSAPNVTGQNPANEIMGGDPSRTTVDRYGNVWVGNRAEGSSHSDGYGGSITEIGIVIGGTRCNADGSVNQNGEYLKPPFIYNTCVDRNGDGLIRTSRGANPLQLPWSNDAGNADSLGGVSTAQDEAILRYVRVAPTAVRTVIVDPNNHLWVGSHPNDGVVSGNGWNEFIDTGAGMPVTGKRINFQGGGYGGVIDGNGAVWAASYNGNENAPGLIRFLPGATMPVTTGGTIRRTGGNYGITVDPSSGDIWQPLFTSTKVMQLRADHCGTRFPISQTQNRGIAIDGLGNVWVGGSGGDANTPGTIFHLTTAGVSVGSVPLSFAPVPQPTINGIGPLGVTMDFAGMVWAICNGGFGAHGYAMRIDPKQNPLTDPNHIPPIGKVVEIVDMGDGSGPYNYSDMSGFVALSATQPSGVWDHVEDAGVAETLWTSLTMDADIPTGTRIVVEVRGANNIAELPSWPFLTVGSGGITPPGTTALPSGIKGRYLEVRANLLRNFGVAQSPELRSLTVQHGSAGCAMQILTHPKSQAVALGANVTFNVAAQVPAGATATYQWLKDGANISGETAATLTINNVNYSHAARYSVKVGATTGCGTFQLESAPARLHVKGNPPAIATDLPATRVVIAGDNTTLTTVATTGPNPEETPINYQWRFNNEPLTGPGTSGNCGGNCSISYQVVAAQCANAGFYSVVFWNQYGQISTRNCELSISGSSQVAVTPSFTTVTDPNQTVDLTASTCLGDVNCVQWYLTSNGQKTAIPPNPPPDDPTNPLKYRLPKPITCDEIGEYTVSVADRAWNSYEESTTVNAAALTVPTAATLKITPDNIGTGIWGYQWSWSDDGELTYNVISGATLDSYTPPQADGERFYRVVATRDGAQSSVRVYYHPGFAYVLAVASLNGTLSVMYTMNPSPIGPFSYHWYFTAEAGGSEVDTGITASQFTINPVDCSKRGYYRCIVSDGCLTSTISKTATLYVNDPIVTMAGMTVKITPDNIGTGIWGYQWSWSYDDLTYNTIPGATLDSYTPPQTDGERFYKVVATRDGAQASVRVYYHSGFPYVQAYAGENVNGGLDVTYTPQVVGIVGTGSWIYQWYFTLEGTTTPVDIGVTSGPYTITGVDCPKRGYYRVDVRDACGTTVDSWDDATVYVQNCL